MCIRDRSDGEGNWYHPKTNELNVYMTSMVQDGEWHAYTYNFTVASHEAKPRVL